MFFQHINTSEPLFHHQSVKTLVVFARIIFHRKQLFYRKTCFGSSDLVANYNRNDIVIIYNVYTLNYNVFTS